jgi:hypothetical protein
VTAQKHNKKRCKDNEKESTKKGKKKTKQQWKKSMTKQKWCNNNDKEAWCKSKNDDVGTKAKNVASCNMTKTNHVISEKSGQVSCHATGPWPPLSGPVISGRPQPSGVVTFSQFLKKQVSEDVEESSEGVRHS